MTIMASAVADVHFLHLKQVFITSSPTVLYDSFTACNLPFSFFPALTPLHTRTLSPFLSIWFHSFVTLWLSIFYSISSLIFILHTPLFLDLCLFLTIYSRKNFHYAAPTTMTTPPPPLPPSSLRWRTKKEMRRWNGKADRSFCAADALQFI